MSSLRAFAFEGAETEAHTSVAHKESCDRTFFGDSDVAAHPFGVAIRGPVINLAHAVGLINQRTIEKPGSSAFDEAIAFLRKDEKTAQGFVWLTTAGNSRAKQLAAGAAYLRANLQATALGVAMHPFSRVLQEYSSMQGAFEAAHRVLAPDGGRVQMFARIGYADAAPSSPKRGVGGQIHRG